MIKNVLIFICIVVVGALIGSFLGQMLLAAFPHGTLHHLFSREMSAGLAPAQLDLHVIQMTFGCMLHFNIMSIIGILLTAFLSRLFLK